jgi:hypothetical protein
MNVTNKTRAGNHGALYEGLTEYRVMLHEAPGDTFRLAFDCWAEDADHAYEQAENAYPGCETLTATPTD